MSPTDQDTTTESPAETITVKKLDNPSPPTEIIINSEDGTIMNADESSEDSSVEDVVVVKTEESAEKPEETEETPEGQPETSGSSDTSSEETATEPEKSHEENPFADVDLNNRELENPAQQSNQMAIPPQPPKQSGLPIVAIIVAITIAVALAGVSVFAYMKIQSDSKSSHQGTNHEVKTDDTPKVETKTLSTDEIDTANKEIDAEISKTTDDADVPTSESMSDTSLGL